MRVVLLHGAGLGSWIWDRVLPHLTRPAVAPPRDERAQTLDDVVTSVAGHLTDDTILVGHSISAMVAMIVAARNREKIAGIVSVGGVVPESGKPFLSLNPLPQRLLLRFLMRKPRISLPKSGIRKQYCNDLDDETTRLVLDRMTPELSRLYLDPAAWSGAPASIPRLYVKLLDDRSVKPSMQDT